MRVLLLQVTETANAWSKVAEQNTVFAVLVAVIITLIGAITVLWVQLNKEREYIRVSDKSNLSVLTDLSKTLETIMSNDNTNTDKIITSITNVKEHVSHQIQSIRNRS